MSDRQYDTEFWFDAAGYTVLDWKANFGSETEAREAFDAWLDSIRAEAWEDGAEACALNIEHATGPKDEITNPYRKEAE